MKRILVVAAATLLIMVVTAVAADDEHIRVHLAGYNETPLTINSAGSAEFHARIHGDGSAIDYEMTYRDLSSTVLQSHIHFGRPAITGGIVLFLCTNLGNAPNTVPVPQACPQPPVGGSATITGTLTAADVIALTNGQAIDSAAAGFAEVLKAIHARAAYVNIHTTNHPGGEIRATLGQRGFEHHKDHRHGHDGDHDHDH